MPSLAPFADALPTTDSARRARIAEVAMPSLAPFADAVKASYRMADYQIRESQCLPWRPSLTLILQACFLVLTGQISRNAFLGALR